MDQCNESVGITIGPIVKTIMNASSPAALWFASFSFSDITRRLCDAISNPENGFNAHILSPYYAGKSEINDGVGKYHDRIIFTSNSLNPVKLDSIIEDVKKNTADDFPFDDSRIATEDFLKKYLQISYVILDEKEIGNENCILKLSQYLDCLELMQTFPEKNAADPFMKIFIGDGRSDSHNELIKRSRLYKTIDSKNNQFSTAGHSNGIRSIESIASCDNKADNSLKWGLYYAVVQADGDGLTKFLKNLVVKDTNDEIDQEKTNQRITSFSKACLEYNKTVAEMIHEFTGMTIYAGGDDLLFLAPLQKEEPEKKKSIFSLCKEINQEFFKAVRTELGESAKDIPTISFGISIQYYKAPLYEAVAQARSLLDEVKSSNETRNSCNINLEKHSGQSIRFLVPNGRVDVLQNIFRIEDNGQTEKKDRTVTSVIHTLELYRDLIYLGNIKVNNEDDYLAAWMNLFDNPTQSAFADYIRKLGKEYYEDFVHVSDNQRPIRVPNAAVTKEYFTEEGKPDPNKVSLKVFLYLLEYKKFMVEKRGDER